MKKWQPHIGMQDVARRAGVSKATVSRVLNKKAEVSEAISSKVIAVCEEMGYRLNYNIQDLVRKSKNDSTQNIAFAFVDKEFADPAYARMLDGIARGIEEYNFHLVLTKLSGDERIVYDLPPLLRDGRVDGVMVTGELNENIIEVLEELGMPYVILGVYSDKLTRNTTTIEFNFNLALMMLVECLKQSGKEKIAYFTESPDNYAEQKEIEAFGQALQENNLRFYKELIYKGTGPFSGAFNIFKPIFTQPELPFDSIVCMDFRTAREISHLILARYGLNQPVDFLLATLRPFDYYKLPVPAVYCNAITEEIAYTGVKALIKRLSDRNTITRHKIVLNPHEVVIKAGD